MPEFIKKQDVKHLIVWLFLSNLALIGVICGGAIWMHQDAISRLEANDKDAKVERAEIRSDIVKIKVSMASIARKP